MFSTLLTASIRNITMSGVRVLLCRWAVEVHWIALGQRYPASRGGLANTLAKSRFYRLGQTGELSRPQCYGTIGVLSGRFQGSACGDLAVFFLRHAPA